MSGNHVLFFEEFFACNNKEVGDKFLKAMNLPEDVEDILRDFYVEHLKEKQMAEKHNIDERTVRNRLAYSRDLCRMKAVGWFSQYFAGDKTV